MFGYILFMTKKLQPNKHSNINNTTSPINILVATKILQEYQNARYLVCWVTVIHQTTYLKLHQFFLHSF